MKSNKLLVISVIAIFMLSSLGAFFVTSPAQASVARSHRLSNTTSTSTNWSGYAVTGTKGSVTFVGGYWTVPTVQSCSSTDTWSSFWVGIDGFNSNSVEQLGTDSDCSSGAPTYYAWREMYPHPAYYINTITVHPGDTIYASVTASGRNSFTLYMKDVTTGVSFSYTAKAKADRSSAEWVVEAPYSGGILPLTDFGKAYFTSDSATISGSTAYINGFSSSSINQINMVSTDGSGTLKDSTSGLSGNGDFSVTWLSQGP